LHRSQIDSDCSWFYLVPTELALDSHSPRICRLETKANMKESGRERIANDVVIHRQSTCVRMDWP